MIIDCTVCPQNIAYPTDLDLLNSSREKSEQIIEELKLELSIQNTYRMYKLKARKAYLKIAKKKSKTRKEIRRGLKQQLQYLRRNIKIINEILEVYPGAMELNQTRKEYWNTLQLVYEQQKEMYDKKTHSVEDRIVSIHQPYVRPIVRGKQKSKVEFGAKIQLSLMNGFAILDQFEWDAFNEGTTLKQSVENYKRIHGYYPKEVLADKIYCNRENRAWLKDKKIELRAKPLGRPSAVQNHVSRGERNPIEGKFGQAKTAYGMDNIKAKLSQTSESWIASIVMVLNLVKLTGAAPYYLLRKFIRNINALFIQTYFEFNQKILSY